MSNRFQVTIVEMQTREVDDMTKRVHAPEIPETEGRQKPPRPEATVAKSSQETILEILGRAADDSGFLAKLAEDPEKVLAQYYVLSLEEKAALASGDIRRIEGRVGKLDKRLATWLWCRMSQEKW